MEAVVEPGLRRPALVLPVAELRWMGRTWLALGAIVLTADFGSGSVAALSAARLEISIGLLALSVATAVAGTLLGMRTPPEMLYAQIFDRAPAPPAGCELDPPRRTASRAGWAALAGALGMAAAAPIAVALALVAVATPPQDLSSALPATGALVAAGWMLACAVSAHALAGWFADWEGRRARVLLCPPLCSGRLSPVYYAGRARPPAA